ncbi:MAG TPA: sterol desaturase family protein [Oculatellaceae cyanobacterium]
MHPDALTLSAQRIAPLILLTYVACISLEIVIAKLLNRKLYDFDDTLHNLIMFFANRMMGGLGGAFMFTVLSTAAQFIPWKLTGLIGNAATFLIVDSLFYVQHRLFHTDSFLAPFHEIHHTSEHYNLTTTLRASVFLPFINPLFYAPAVILGCDPLAIIVAFSLIQVYQFFLHTQLVPTLGPLEGLVNTPSAHRVHHGSEQAHYESNLGGVFLIWDRLLDTYTSESVGLVFGIKGVKQENNFFVAQVKPFVVYVRRLMKQIGSMTT